jgi:hypothetical protein
MTNEFHAFLEHYGLREPFMIAPLKRCAASSRYRFDFSRRFDRLIRELGINCTFHDLRRTFASLKVSSSVSIYKSPSGVGTVSGSLSGIMAISFRLTTKSMSALNAENQRRS